MNGACPAPDPDHRQRPVAQVRRPSGRPSARRSRPGRAWSRRTRRTGARRDGSAGTPSRDSSADLGRWRSVGGGYRATRDHRRVVTFEFEAELWVWDARRHRHLDLRQRAARPLGGDRPSGRRRCLREGFGSVRVAVTVGGTSGVRRSSRRPPIDTTSRSRRRCAALRISNPATGSGFVSSSSTSETPGAHQTLPGLKMFSGSRASLTARCRAIDAGSSSRCIPSRLSRPIAVLAGHRAAEGDGRVEHLLERGLRRLARRVVPGRGEQQRVQVAVAGVRDGGHPDVVPLRDVEQLRPASPAPSTAARRRPR